MSSTIRLFDFDIPVPEVDKNEEEFFIAGSDTHGSLGHVDLMYKVAEELNSRDGVKVNGIFNLGDMGSKKSSREYFFEKFKKYDVFVVKGNHDREKKLRKTIEKYPNARLIDDEVIEYHGLKIIGMGLWPMQQTANELNLEEEKFKFRYYQKRLGELLEENPDAILMSHFGEIGLERKTIRNGIKRWLGKGHIELMKEYDHPNPHGHVHPSVDKNAKLSSKIAMDIEQTMMYLNLGPINYRNEIRRLYPTPEAMKKLVQVFDPTTRKANGARRVLIIPKSIGRYARAK